MSLNYSEIDNRKILCDYVNPSKENKYVDGTISYSKLTGDVSLYICNMWIVLRRGTKPYEIPISVTDPVYIGRLEKTNQYEHGSCFWWEFECLKEYSIFQGALIVNNSDTDLPISKGLMTINHAGYESSVFAVTVPGGDTYWGEHFVINRGGGLIVWIKTDRRWDIYTHVPKIETKNGDVVTYYAGSLQISALFPEDWSAHP